MRKYNQISTDERDKIAVLNANGFNLSDIARLLGRNRSTISREISRKASSQYKCYSRIMHKHEARQARKQRVNTHQRLKNDAIRTYVEEKLQEDFSPEQIAGGISIDCPGLGISHEAIYQIYLQ